MCEGGQEVGCAALRHTHDARLKRPRGNEGKGLETYSRAVGIVCVVEENKLALRVRSIESDINYILYGKGELEG
jgi:hypothetical protein